MTQKANPSINRPAEAYKTAGAIAYGGYGDSGFIVDGASPTDISTQDAGINEANLDAFSLNGQYSASSLDVTINAGEAFVFGSWIANDQATTVTLPASTTVSVFVGWNKSGADDVIVGTPSAFSPRAGDTDEKIELYEFTTDGSGVTNVVDNRQIGYKTETENLTLAGNELDADGDGIFDNADVNALTSFSSGDSFSGYPLSASTDLSNDSVTINTGTDLSGGGSVSLGGSVSISHSNTTSQGNVSTGGASIIDDINLDGNGHVSSINTQNRSLNDWSVPSDFNINSADRFGLPQRTTDPSANAGDMWYRTDLD